jgi:hypothetical protein
LFLLFLNMYLPQQLAVQVDTKVFDRFLSWDLTVSVVQCYEWHVLFLVVNVTCVDFLAFVFIRHFNNQRTISEIYVNYVGVLPPLNIQVCWVFRRSQTTGKGKHRVPDCFRGPLNSITVKHQSVYRPDPKWFPGGKTLLFSQRNIWSTNEASDRYWVSENTKLCFKLQNKSPLPDWPSYLPNLVRNFYQWLFSWR